MRQGEALDAGEAGEVALGVGELRAGAELLRRGVLVGALCGGVRECQGLGLGGVLGGLGGGWGGVARASQMRPTRKMLQEEMKKTPRKNRANTRSALVGRAGRAQRRHGRGEESGGSALEGPLVGPVAGLDAGGDVGREGRREADAHGEDVEGGDPELRLGGRARRWHHLQRIQSSLERESKAQERRPVAPSGISGAERQIGKRWARPGGSRRGGCRRMGEGCWGSFFGRWERRGARWAGSAPSSRLQVWPCPAAQRGRTVRASGVSGDHPSRNEGRRRHFQRAWNRWNHLQNVLL